ncbi:hypothetical protein GBF38_004703 [Nibea albiflora]|uniref:Uncharacterized protein n=1 Tax=Nibea albiflora TaxID=240163 RepID=A0ACB7FD60_NIBAL|nr:hypothetical protein GBF38_004703 [Nibea albiflora]
MSQFLGRQDCIESLRKDLVDLQGATLDVFSRTGPVRFSSWKFPDKLSCSLDMVALLEQYDFVHGEDAFNQHSHIVLLELVIDRASMLTVEQISCSHGREQTRQKGCLSVGLVVRNYWSNLVQFASPKVINKDIKKQTKASDCDDTESVSSVSSHQMSSRSDFCRRCLSAPTSSSSFNKFLGSSSPTNNSARHPEVDSRNVSCQTIQSSLLPCAACHQVQSTLRKTGDALVELFQSEGLPSSLQPLLVAVEDTLDLGHMTAGDVAQWANEQLRDMRRLAKHLEDVRGTVQPLRDRLAVAETERERFRSQLERAQKEFKQEREKHQANTVQLEFSLRKAQRSLKETEQRLQEEQQHFKRETLSLEESNSRLNEKVAQQEDTLQAAERENNVLQEKLASLHMEEEACCKLQQKIQQLEDKISETQLHLDKENAKYHSACRQQESMQAKQKSLLKRVDALDEECEELQRQLGEREEREMDLSKQLQQMSEEKERAQAQLAQQQNLCFELQNEKQTLENTRRRAEEQRGRAEGVRTGNVLLDMEQQLQANDIRIKVLEQENITLHASLVKLRERVRNNASREASPQQTWSLSAPSTPTEKQPDHLMHLQSSPLAAVHRGWDATVGTKQDGGKVPGQRITCPPPPLPPPQLCNFTFKPST